MLIGESETMIAKMLTFMSEKAGGYIDYILYGLLGLQVVLLIVGVICALSGGELKTFTKLAQGYLKGRIQGETAVMKQMPLQIKKLYKRARKTSGGKPSDWMTPEACVFSPYKASFASKLTAYTAYSTIIAVAIGGGLGVLCGGVSSALVIVALCAALGAILTAVAALISSSLYKGAYKTYVQFINRLDGDTAAQPAPQAQEYEQPAESFTAYEPQAEQAAEPVVEQPVYQQPVYEGGAYEQPVFEQQPETFEQPVFAQASEKIDYEPATEPSEPIVTAQPAEPVIEPVVQEDPAAARAKAKAEAIAAMKAEQERIRKEQEERARAMQAEMQAKAAAEAQAKAAAEAKADTVSTEDVIARIEQIDRDGAPLSTMKEVALLLQKERSKPENKTPEQQRKLNEALSKLLKAMSAARK